jgi:hypothetical protein
MLILLQQSDVAQTKVYNADHDGLDTWRRSYPIPSYEPTGKSGWRHQCETLYKSFY